MATTLEPLHPNTSGSKASPGEAPSSRLEMVRIFARVSQALEPSVTAEWIVKRLLFLSYELQSAIALDLPVATRLKFLNDFIFKRKMFKTCPPRARTEMIAADDPSDHFRMGRLLSTRTGSATVLALVYSYLAEAIGLELEFVDLKAASVLKWTDRNDGPPRCRYIDINREGAILSNDELIESLQLNERALEREFVAPSNLEAFTLTTYVCKYLRDVKSCLVRKGDPETLLVIQNLLIDHDPGNLRLLGDRALLQRRLGNFKCAIRDLKRYFAFQDRAKAPPELVILFEELSQLLGPS